MSTGPNQYNWCPYKEGKFGLRDANGKMVSMRIRKKAATKKEVRNRPHLTSLEQSTCLEFELAVSRTMNQQNYMLSHQVHDTSLCISEGKIFKVLP